MFCRAYIKVQRQEIFKRQQKVYFFGRIGRRTSILFGRCLPFPKNERYVLKAFKNIFNVLELHRKEFLSRYWKPAICS